MSGSSDECKWKGPGEQKEFQNRPDCHHYQKAYVFIYHPFVFTAEQDELYKYSLLSLRFHKTKIAHVGMLKLIIYNLSLM